VADLTALPSFLRAAHRDRALATAERRDRAWVTAHQRHALQRIVVHARARSPVYRRLYEQHGVDERAPLHALPPVDKAELMERFDEWVTDPRITLADAQRHLQEGRDGLLADAFVVLASGGSSRHPGVYVFDRDEWTTVLATSVRASRWIGNAPRLPRRRVAFVLSSGGRHMAARVGRGFDVGVHRVLRLPATMPRDELTAALNAFRPETLSGYASILALLAAEQLDGELAIAPSIVTASSEPLTAEMSERMRAAWGVAPFDLYATTETGMLALDCVAHEGRHVFEDLTILEVVDADDKPVPDGEPGHHLLITNLYNRTQPFIRYRLSDMTAYEPGQCACGLPFRRLRPIDGRHDDILQLAGHHEERVDVHPTAFAPLFSLDGVAELEIVQRGEKLHLAVVPRASAQPDAVRALIDERTRELLDQHGCPATRYEVYLTEQLSRHPIAGKIKLIRRDQEPAPASDEPSTSAS
jgi:phenylacetate-coenzyme A ligase PaaK-like adenylate-forming protein